MNQKNLFRKSDYFEVIKRNESRPGVIYNIKYKLRETFAILASGFAYTNAADFCAISEKTIIKESTFYDYQKKMEPILRRLADRICSQKVNDALQKKDLVAAFDACYAHRRNANQCIGILLDVLTGFILAYHIVHHSDEENETLSSTKKHAKAMEKKTLKKMLTQTSIEKSINCTFIHDCDIGADNIVRKLWPSALILYDPNHYTKSQSRKIQSICSENTDLNAIKERLVRFYSMLMHDRQKSLEEKVEEWKGSLDHYISTEGWTTENNSQAIEALRQLIEKFSTTFNKINPKYSTNPCESFNKTRCILANKDIAWRVSWRIRAYISIIRWNDQNWIQTILREFDIFDDTLTLSQKNRQKRTTTKSIRETEEYKKNRAIKRKQTKEKYKLKSNEKNIHEYLEDKISKKKKSNSENIKKGLSKYQKLILSAIIAYETEDKKYVFDKKIHDYIVKYEENLNLGTLKKTIKNQITRMIRSGLLKRKKNSYK